MSVELLLALVVMLIGLIGCLLPFLPGPALIWLGALFYAWTTSFQGVGWGTLALLFALMLAAVTSGFWVSAIRQRQAGVSLYGALLSLVLGIVGLAIFSLPGLLIGSIIGATAPDYIRYHDWRRSLRLTRSALVSYMIGAVVEFGLGVLMILIFLIRIWAR